MHNARHGGNLLRSRRWRSCECENISVCPHKFLLHKETANRSFALGFRSLVFSKSRYSFFGDDMDRATAGSWTNSFGFDDEHYVRRKVVASAARFSGKMAWATAPGTLHRQRSEPQRNCSHIGRETKRRW